MKRTVALLSLGVGMGVIGFAEGNGHHYGEEKHDARIAPEISGGSGATALALLSGGLLILRARRKKLSRRHPPAE